MALSAEQIAANRKKLAQTNPAMYQEILRMEARTAANGGVADSVSQGHTGYANADEFLGENYWSGHEAALTSPATAARNARIAEAGRIRNDIRGRGGELNAIYDQLFGDLDTLLRTRSSDVEKDYGDQLSKATEQYSSALPTIQNSYAAIGAADSTDTADAKDAAKKGFDDTTTTIGKNKQKDLAAIGQYGNEQRAKIQGDKDSLNRELGRLDETEDVDALRGTRSNIETNLGAANVTKQTLGTEGKAANDLKALTKDAGRFEAASNALDNILKSSMSGAVKEAAVKAIVDNAGLSDDEKEKVQLQYGNVYQEQNAA